MSEPTAIALAAPQAPEWRRGRAIFLIAFAAVLAGRLWFLAELPIVSRDGAMYCELARSLSERGVAALRSPGFDQHPLFPLSILGVHRALLAAGLPDTPVVWQRAGQIVGFFSGGVVLLLIAALTRAAWRRFVGTPSDTAAATWAVLLAGVLPLNVWLSADVMSEPLFLAFYLGAIACFLRPVGIASYSAIGVLSGLAFLVRPEAAALPVAASAAVAVGVAEIGSRRALPALVALALGFAAVATPYWAALGGFSPKVNKAALEAVCAELFEPIEQRSAMPRLARLTVEPAGWYAAPVITAYETCRGGRVVVPLLALPAIVVLRRRLIAAPWLGVAVAVGAHFALCTLLRYRHGYLDPRHTLPIVELLIPFAALALGQAAQRLRPRRLAWTAALAGAACCGVLAGYCMKERDTKSVYLLEIVEGLHRDAAASPGALLVGGSTHRRVAFYADMPFFKWPEDLPTEDERLAGLRDVLGGLRPTHFIIETGDGDERRGDETVLARLLDAPPAGVRLTPIFTRPFDAGKKRTIVHLFRISHEAQ